MPAGHRLLALSDVPDRQRRDGPPELVTIVQASPDELPEIDMHAL
jgi:hypothetical protein